jgi:hypothetical protein
MDGGQDQLAENWFLVWEIGSPRCLRRTHYIDVLAAVCSTHTLEDSGSAPVQLLARVDGQQKRSFDGGGFAGSIA